MLFKMPSSDAISISEGERIYTSKHLSEYTNPACLSFPRGRNSTLDGVRHGGGACVVMSRG